jgi:hypothetical protein
VKVETEQLTKLRLGRDELLQIGRREDGQMAQKLLIIAVAMCAGRTVRPSSWYNPAGDINFENKIGFAIFRGVEKVRDEGRT